MVTRAPRLDAIVAPEKSFFRPSVDRQIGTCTVLDATHPPVPHEPPVSVPAPHTSALETRNSKWAAGKGNPGEQHHLLPALVPSHLLHPLGPFTAAGLPFPRTLGRLPAPPRHRVQRRRALPDPRLRGRPVSAPGASEDSPGALALPGWHGLTFPEDAVHAVQGVRIAARSERGRRQGWSFPGAPAAPPPPRAAAAPRAAAPAPVLPVRPRCSPSAGAVLPPRGHTDPARPDPSSLPPPALTCAAGPAAASRRSASCRAESGLSGAAAPETRAAPGPAPGRGQRPSRRVTTSVRKGTRKLPPATHLPAATRGAGAGAATEGQNNPGPSRCRAPRTGPLPWAARSGARGPSHRPSCCRVPAMSLPQQQHQDTSRTDLTFTMSAGVPTNPPVKPVTKEEPGSGGSSSLREPGAVGPSLTSHCPQQHFLVEGGRPLAALVQVVLCGLVDAKASQGIRHLQERDNEPLCPAGCCRPGPVARAACQLQPSCTTRGAALQEPRAGLGGAGAGRARQHSPAGTARR